MSAEGDQNSSTLGLRANGNDSRRSSNGCQKVQDLEEMGSSGFGSLDISDNEKDSDADDEEENSSASSKDSVIQITGRIRDRHHSFGTLSSQLQKTKPLSDQKKVR